MIWFWVPASLVIFNDVAAYVCGSYLAVLTALSSGSDSVSRSQVWRSDVTNSSSSVPRRPLRVSLELSSSRCCSLSWYARDGSPASSQIADPSRSSQWGTLFMRSNYMICPVHDLSTTAFSNITCKPNHVFDWHSAPLPQSVTAALQTLVRACASFIVCFVLCSTWREICASPYDSLTSARSQYLPRIAPSSLNRPAKRSRQFPGRPSNSIRSSSPSSLPSSLPSVGSSPVVSSARSTSRISATRSPGTVA